MVVKDERLYVSWFVTKSRVDADTDCTDPLAAVGELDAATVYAVRDDQVVVGLQVYGREP